MVKSFLDERGVEYAVRRVAAERGVAEQFVARGWRLPPVVEVGAEAIEGFDPARLEELLERAGY